MYFIRKLRPPKMSIETIFGLILLPLVLILFIFAGFQATFGVIAVVEFFAVVIQVILYIRTRNINFLLMALALAMIFIFALAIAILGLERARGEFRVLSLLVILASVIVIYIVTNKKVKWRTREILELSAMPVSGVENGFTERPMPAGKIEATGFELESFASFLRENQIAIPYADGGAVVFSLTSNYWKQIGLKSGYEDESWVRIDPNGLVSASISKEHYLKFRDRFSFDQLCQSLGALFIDFFELYRNGEGKKIIERCDRLGLNPFIE